MFLQVVNYLVKEYKSAVDTAWYGSLSMSLLFVALERWWMDLTINSVLTFTVSFIAIMTGSLKGLSYWAERRKLNAETRKINAETRAIEEDIKRKNRSW